MRLLQAVLFLALLTAAMPAQAEPGLAAQVYGPTVHKGEVEVESRSGMLVGGAGDGEWASLAEVAYAPTDWWRPALLVEAEREPGEDAQIEEVALENVVDFTATRTWPVHLGAYAEYAFNTQGDDDALELKLLAERNTGPLGLRVNLIGEHTLADGAPWEFGYAAQALWSLNDDLALGVEGFGDAGTDDDFGDLGKHAHYWGPVVRAEVFESARGELELTAGYLAGFGDSESDSQIRFAIAWER